MKKQDNERLCTLAQKGDTEARDLLLKTIWVSSAKPPMRFI